MIPDDLQEQLRELLFFILANEDCSPEMHRVVDSQVELVRAIAFIEN